MTTPYDAVPDRGAIPDPQTPAPPVDEDVQVAHAQNPPSLKQKKDVPAPNPQTPQPPVHEDFDAGDAQAAQPLAKDDFVEKTLRRLQDAARRIAVVEQKERDNQAPQGLLNLPSRRTPRASRLSPLRDISADIRRHSTPMPGTFNGSSEKHSKEALGSNLPDLWPWLQDPDSDENEHDNWTGTDPLMSRHVPDGTEAARIDAEDERRAIAATATKPLKTAQLVKKRANITRLRTIFACVALLTVFALTVDGILVSFAFFHRARNTSITISPILTLLPNIVKYGQIVTLDLKSFPSQTNVYLTHDIAEPLLTMANTPVIPTREDGSAQITIAIDGSWKPGFHKITAEDIKQRYTTSATLQVAEGPTRPSHLILNPTELDLGAGIQGANTIQPLTLQNSGNGAIIWAASSNASWLQLTPNQGAFSNSQTIMVGAQRANLKPGDYRGTITISNSVGATQYVQVTMTVRPLPPNVGAALAVAPAVLSFVATEGAANPNAQALVISNPGNQPLHWMVQTNTAANANQNGSIQSPGTNALSPKLDSTSGVIDPHGSNTIHVTVNSASLLPGTYNSTLILSTSAGYTAYNSPQNVMLSLNVQPPCSLQLSTPIMAFTAVAGKSNPSSQTLNVSTSTNCANTIDWNASSSAPWLVITPAKGQLNGTNSAAMTINANVATLTPGLYSANVTVQTQQNSQSVAVQLTVQPPLAPTAPNMSALPLNVNFSTIQGQSRPPGQAVTIANTGGSLLTWRTTINYLALNWLGVSPTGGTIAAGQAGIVTINVDPSKLSPGTYMGQVVLTGSDSNNAVAGGSPQTVTVNLTVSSPCTLTQPSSSSLAFNAVANGSDPATQTISILAAGNCSWPLNWQTHIKNGSSWLKISPANGSFTASGQSATVTVAPTVAGLAPGTYTEQVSISATDATGTQAQGGPQSFSVTLTVQQACSLSVSPGTLRFSQAQGQATQTLHLTETGSCASTVNWTASVDAGSSSWLSVTGQGSETGNGSTITVTANTGSLLPNTYKGSITISATGSSGTAIPVSPQAIPVTLIFTGLSIQGTINECMGNSCNNTKPLSGATVTLSDSNGQAIATASTDAAGKYSFTNIAPGSYTVSVSADNKGKHYQGSKFISINGNLLSQDINTQAG